MRTAFLTIAGVAVLLLLPSFLMGSSEGDSAIFNQGWTAQFAQALSRGELYPRWLPGSFEGLGSPTFYFYPPIAFYVSGLFDLAGLSTQQAINAAGLVALSASGLTMYAWLRFRGGRALLGACLYMAAPYHLVDLYQRAALAEFAAFAWLPLIALGIEAYPRRWSGPLLAIAFAGLTMTHLPTAVLAGLVLIAPMVVRQFIASRDLVRLGASALCGTAALALAAIYLVPALTLQDHIAANFLWSPYYQPANWSPFARNGVVDPGVFLWLGPLALVSVVLAGGAAFAGGRKAWFWPGLTIAAAILGLGLIPGIWALPGLEKVQFPWRIFSIMEFAAVTAICTAPAIPRQALIAAIVVACSCYARLGLILAQVIGAPPSARLQETASIEATEYLPAGFVAPYITAFYRIPDLKPFRGAAVQGPVSRVEAGDHGGMRIEVSAPGTVIIRRFAFPAWQVERDGKPVETRAEGPGRLITFDAQPGIYRLVRKILPEERHGLWLSLLGLMLLIALSLTSGRSRRPNSLT